MVKGWFLGVMVGVFVLGFGASFVIENAKRSRAVDIYGEVPQFDFVGHNGEPFSLEDMIGSLSVVDFIFTSCKDACPRMTSVMQELYEFYGGSPKIKFVSFSVDPEVDTVPALRAYADKFGVKDRQWTFVRSPLKKIKELSEKGFYLSARNLPMGHSTKFVLVDQNGMIRGFYNSFSQDKITLLKNQIKELARNVQ